jgi:hypothetical protein
MSALLSSARAMASLNAGGRAIIVDSNGAVNARYQCGPYAAVNAPRRPGFGQIERPEYNDATIPLTYQLLSLSLEPDQEENLAKTNFQFEKRQRELEKKKKKEEKKQRKLSKQEPAPTEAPAEATGEGGGQA